MSTDIPKVPGLEAPPEQEESVGNTPEADLNKLKYSIASLHRSIENDLQNPDNPELGQKDTELTAQELGEAVESVMKTHSDLAEVFSVQDIFSMFDLEMANPPSVTSQSNLEKSELDRLRNNVVVNALPFMAERLGGVRVSEITTMEEAMNFLKVLSHYKEIRDFLALAKETEIDSIPEFRNVSKQIEVLTDLQQQIDNKEDGKSKEKLIDEFIARHKPDILKGNDVTSTLHDLKKVQIDGKSFLDLSLNQETKMIDAVKMKENLQGQLGIYIMEIGKRNFLTNSAGGHSIRIMGNSLFDQVGLTHLTQADIRKDATSPTLEVSTKKDPTDLFFAATDLKSILRGNRFSQFESGMEDVKQKHNTVIQTKVTALETDIRNTKKTPALTEKEITEQLEKGYRNILDTQLELYQEEYLTAFNKSAVGKEINSHLRQLGEKLSKVSKEDIEAVGTVDINRQEELLKSIPDSVLKTKYAETYITLVRTKEINKTYNEYMREVPMNEVEQIMYLFKKMMGSWDFFIGSAPEKEKLKEKYKNQRNSLFRQLKDGNEEFEAFNEADTLEEFADQKTWAGLEIESEDNNKVKAFMEFVEVPQTEISLEKFKEMISEDESLDIQKMAAKFDTEEEKLTFDQFKDLRARLKGEEGVVNSKTLFWDENTKKISYKVNKFDGTISAEDPGPFDGGSFAELITALETTGLEGDQTFLKELFKNDQSLCTQAYEAEDLWEDKDKGILKKGIKSVFEQCEKVDHKIDSSNLESLNKAQKKGLLKDTMEYRGSENQYLFVEGGRIFKSEGFIARVKYEYNVETNQNFATPYTEIGGVTKKCGKSPKTLLFNGKQFKDFETFFFWLNRQGDQTES